MDYDRRSKAAAAPLSSAQSREILGRVSQMLGILAHGGVVGGPNPFLSPLDDETSIDDLQDRRKRIDALMEDVTKVLFGIHHPEAKDFASSALKHMQVASKRAVGGEDMRVSLAHAQMRLDEAIDILTKSPDRGELLMQLAELVERLVPRDTYLEQRYDRTWEIATKLAQTETRPKMKAWLEELAAGAKQAQEGMDALRRAAAFSHRMLPKVKSR